MSVSPRASKSFQELLIVRHSASLPETGFTILELVVSALVFTLAASMVGVLVGVSSRSTQSTQQVAEASSAIESDIARVRALAESYTCCAGTCTTTPTASADCIGTLGDSSYYFPQQSAGVTAFTALCSNGGLTDALMTSIDGLSQPTGVTRAAVVKEDAAAHRLSITYSGSNGVNKVVKIVPTVAGWCP